MTSFSFAVTIPRILGLRVKSPKGRSMLNSRSLRRKRSSIISVKRRANSRSSRSCNQVLLRRSCLAIFRSKRPAIMEGLESILVTAKLSWARRTSPRNPARAGRTRKSRWRKWSSPWRNQSAKNARTPTAIKKNLSLSMLSLVNIFIRFNKVIIYI